MSGCRYNEYITLRGEGNWLNADVVNAARAKVPIAKSFRQNIETANRCVAPLCNVESVQMCKEAATSLTKQYKAQGRGQGQIQEQNSAYHPKGCYTDGTDIYFNAHSKGMTVLQHHVICVADGCAPSSYPVKLRIRTGTIFNATKMLPKQQLPEATALARDSHNAAKSGKVMVVRPSFVEQCANGCNSIKHRGICQVGCAGEHTEKRKERCNKCAATVINKACPSNPTASPTLGPIQQKPNTQQNAYALNTNNKNTCEVGSRITNEDKCKAAAVATGLQYKGRTEKKYESRVPKGCYKFTGSMGGGSFQGVWYNRGSTGAEEPEHYLLCQKNLLEENSSRRHLLGRRSQQASSQLNFSVSQVACVVPDWLPIGSQTQCDIAAVEIGISTRTDFCCPHMTTFENEPFGCFVKAGNQEERDVGEHVGPHRKLLGGKGCSDVQNKGTSTSGVRVQIAGKSMCMYFNNNVTMMDCNRSIRRYLNLKPSV